MRFYLLATIATLIVALAFACSGGKNSVTKVYVVADDDHSPATDDDDNNADDDDNDDNDDTTPPTDDDNDDDASPSDTWTDPVSGLMWQIHPTGFGFLTWATAKSQCDGLTLGGYSDWRLPTISELRGLIRGCAVELACGVADSCLKMSCYNAFCKGCADNGGPAGGCYWPSQMQGDCSFAYWSSSAVENGGNLAWYVGFSTGEVYFDYTTSLNAARCVR